MEFNVKGVYIEDFDEYVWFLSEEKITERAKLRLIEGYTEVLSMFMSPNPFLLKIVEGRRPYAGELSPDVFFCPNTKFDFEGGVLANSSFFDNCLQEHGFVDSLVDLGNITLEDSRNIGRQIDQWGYDHGLYCFNVY